MILRDFILIALLIVAACGLMLILMHNLQDQIDGQEQEISLLKRNLMQCQTKVEILEMLAKQQDKGFSNEQS